MNVAFIAATFSRYMMARYRACAKAGIHMSGIEVSGVGTYDVPTWRDPAPRDGLGITTLFNNLHYSRVQTKELRCRMAQQLSRQVRNSNTVVAVLGWATIEARLAVRWCALRAVPCVVMSDTRVGDARRFALKEWLKARLVRHFGAAIVAGEPHVKYLQQLGMPRHRIFTGYDVVDNAHFSTGAHRARRQADILRTKLCLPQKYFLACTRLVPEKNLPRLLAAYAVFNARSGSDAPSLVIVGDGPLRALIAEQIVALRLTNRVVLAGPRTYEELPPYYGLAQACVHSSTNDTWALVVNEAMASGLPVLVSNHCGCASDLVQEGRNGFLFDPYDVDGLAQLMLKISCMRNEERDSMGGASQEIISRWTPETFATSLSKAIDAALAAPQQRINLPAKAFLWAVTHR